MIPDESTFSSLTIKQNANMNANECKQVLNDNAPFIQCWMGFTEEHAPVFQLEDGARRSMMGDNSTLLSYYHEDAKTMYEVFHPARPKHHRWAAQPMRVMQEQCMMGKVPSKYHDRVTVCFLVILSFWQTHLLSYAQRCVIMFGINNIVTKCK